MYFWTLNSNMFPEFLYHPHFSLQVKGLESSVADGVFLPWAPWRIMDFFSQEDGVVFCNDVWSVMEVLGHECNPDQWRLFIDSSKVSLKGLYSTTEINSPPFLWLMQPTWRKVMKAWNYCWERLSMTNLSESYVVISRLWHCYSEWNSGTQNTAVSCVSGTAGTRWITL